MAFEAADGDVGSGLVGAGHELRVIRMGERGWHLGPRIVGVGGLHRTAHAGEDDDWSDDEEEDGDQADDPVPAPGALVRFR